MEYIKSAFSAMMENKARSFLTMLGIIIGIASVITILAIGNGMKTSIGGELNDMQSGSITMQIDGKKTDRVLNGAQIREIGESVPEAFGASPTTSLYAEFKSGRGINGTVILSAGNENMFLTTKERVVDGRFFNETEAESAAAVGVCSEADAIRLFRTADGVGQELLATLGSQTRSVRIIGVIESKDEDKDEAWKSLKGEDSNVFARVYIPYTLLTQGYAMIDDKFQSYALYPKPDQYDAAALRAQHATENLLGIRGQKAVSVQSYASMVEQFSKILNVVTLVVAMIAAISLLVGGIGVMNIMTVSVTERTREIGIRKALGARTSSILTQFLAESAMITLVGGCIGMAFGYGLTAIVANFMSFPPVVKISDVLMVSSISISIGLFFGIYPAFRAAKLNPIEALRYE